MTQAFIPYGCYWSTPFAKWQGSLSHLHSLKLAARCAQLALAAKSFPTERIDVGILGTTVPQLSSFYGVPWMTAMTGLPGITGPTVAQACATSARVLQTAAEEIAVGSASCVLSVAADRCSNGPTLLYPEPSASGGTARTEAWVMDNFSNDPYALSTMVETADRVASRYAITTAQQHEVALQRYHQYQQALAGERAFQRRYMVEVPITDADFRKQTGMLSADEGVFATTAEGLAKLKPVKPNGSVTFGGQTHPADGNAGVVVTSREWARELSRDAGIEVQLLGFGQARVDKGLMPMAPVPAAYAALAAAGLAIQDIDAVKTHNPFAVNDIVFARDTGFDLARMNNYGSPLVWGHPQGPTGLRCVIELIEELAQRGGGKGLFTGCAAGDSAMAVVLEVRDAR